MSPNEKTDCSGVGRNAEKHRFEVVVDGQTALLAYQEDAAELNLIHTAVPKSLEGRGIGSRLTVAALEYAREHKLKVVPSCPFVAKYIERHPEYSELL